METIPAKKGRKQHDQWSEEAAYLEQQYTGLRTCTTEEQAAASKACKCVEERKRTVSEEKRRRRNIMEEILIKR